MITQEYLKSVLEYDPTTGVFKSIKTGKKLGYIDAGYERIEIKRKAYYTHRLAWLYMYGEFPELDIDHINCNKLDNRICNLRVATCIENLRNTGKNKRNTSGAKNVYFHKPTLKWQVRVNVGGRSKHLGLYDDFELADLVATEARNKYHGEFARG